MEVVESNPVSGEPINVWGLDLRTIATKITKPNVVQYHINDVWAAWPGVHWQTITLGGVGYRPANRTSERVVA
jgi:hypothetical protein